MNELNLPDLSGTEKQIAWANDIRSKWVAALERYTKEACTDYPVQDKTIDSVVYVLENTTKASQYINSRQLILWVDNPRFAEYSLFSGNLDEDAPRAKSGIFKTKIY